jgi:hypothetical protein
MYINEITRQIMNIWFEEGGENLYDRLYVRL